MLRRGDITWKKLLGGLILASLVTLFGSISYYMFGIKIVALSAACTLALVALVILGIYLVTEP
jgi:hypothetical protein